MWGQLRAHTGQLMHSRSWQVRILTSCAAQAKRHSAYHPDDAKAGNAAPSREHDEVALCWRVGLRDANLPRARHGRGWGAGQLSEQCTARRRPRCAHTAVVPFESPAPTPTAGEWARRGCSARALAGFTPGVRHSPPRPDRATHASPSRRSRCAHAGAAAKPPPTLNCPRARRGRSSPRSPRPVNGPSQPPVRAPARSRARRRRTWPSACTILGYMAAKW